MVGAAATSRFVALRAAARRKISTPTVRNASAPASAPATLASLAATAGHEAAEETSKLPAGAGPIRILSTAMRTEMFGLPSGPTMPAANWISSGTDSTVATNKPVHPLSSDSSSESVKATARTPGTGMAGSNDLQIAVKFLTREETSKESLPLHIAASSRRIASPRRTSTDTPSSRRNVSLPGT